MIIWMITWGVAGAIAVRHRYLHRDLDTSNANFVGAMMGVATGPVGLAYLWARTPQLTNKFILFPALLAVTLIAGAFAFADPSNNCVVNGSFVASQFTNGLIM